MWKPYKPSTQTNTVIETIAQWHIDKIIVTGKKVLHFYPVTKNASLSNKVRLQVLCQLSGAKDCYDTRVSAKVKMLSATVEALRLGYTIKDINPVNYSRRIALKELEQ